MNERDRQMTDYALRITETVARLQRELKCGICCSTYKDPILSTCFHMFCRSCINSCFERKRKVQCPICRTVLDKRSCRDAYQVTMAVQNYLKLSEAFKKDIEGQKTFRALPPEVMFMESQMPLDVTIIPENDGKRCAPDFAIPMLPVRRKRPSKPKPEPVIEEPTDIQIFPHQQPTSSSAVAPPVPEVTRKETKDAETSTESESPRISVDELQNVDIRAEINTIREKEPGADDIDALFRLIPSMRPFIEQNLELLMRKMGIERKEEKENIQVAAPPKNERRVSFASLQPKSPEKISKVEEQVSNEEDDEVVADSEGEEVQENVTANTTSTTLDADRTARAIQDDAERLDEELSHVPKTIVCSRIHNDEDEVELLSDFYHKFLSNACRFAEEVDAHTTHLVMMNSEGRSIPQKSTSYLLAISRKCIVVGRQWLVDCLKTGLLLSESDYTITSCSAALPSQIQMNSEIGWLRSRNDADGKLFTGCRFMILRKFTMNPYFDYKQLIELVQQCDGELLSSYDNLTPDRLFIVFSRHSKAIGEARHMQELYKCSVVTIEWVLDCVSEYCLLPCNEYSAVWAQASQE